MTSSTKVKANRCSGTVHILPPQHLPKPNPRDERNSGIVVAVPTTKAFVQRSCRKPGITPITSCLLLAALCSQEQTLGPRQMPSMLTGDEPQTCVKSKTAERYGVRDGVVSSLLKIFFAIHPSFIGRSLIKWSQIPKLGRRCFLLTCIERHPFTA